MTNLNKYNIAVARYERLSAKPVNWKSRGVLRKIEREIRNLKKLL